jgi:hypothetical protein
MDAATLAYVSSWASMISLVLTLINAGIADLFRSIQTGKVDIEGFIRKLVAG